MATTPDPAPSFLRATIQRAGSLVLVPPRFVARHVPLPAFLSDASSATASIPDRPPARPAVPPASAPFQLPAPITYLTSPYLFATLALAFFLHRIRHLVPPRQAFTAPARNLNPGVRTAMHRVLRPAVQVGVRAPGILLMLRAAIACLVAIPLAHGHARSLAWLFPVGPGDRATVLGHVARSALRLVVWSSAWAGKGQLGALLAARTESELARAVAHDALLWSAFLAASLGLACETFVRALADDTSNSQHLNLVSFSFLLHVHSSPTRRAAGEPAEGARPGADAEGDGGAAWHAPTNLYTFLVLLLAELVALQLSYCAHFVLAAHGGGRAPGPGRRASPRRYRLPITAVFSLAQQYFALRSWAVVWGLVPATAAERAAEAEQFGTVWLNKVPEICFELVVGASVAVKALAAAIRGDELSFENVVGHPAMAPTSEEDYPVALIKYSTHLLSSTRLSGLALELDPVALLPLAVASHLENLGLVDPAPCGDPRCELHGPEMRMRAAVGPAVTLGRAGEVLFDDDDEGGGATAAPAGLAREVRRVHVAAGSDGGGHGGGENRSTGGLTHLEGERKGALVAFAHVVARVTLFVVWRAWRRVRRVARGGLARGGWRRDEWELERRWAAERGEAASPDFAAPDGDADADDDDDGEWVPSRAESESSEWEEDEDGRARSPTPDDDAEEDVAPLALVHAANADETDDLSPYLLAHQLSRSAGPLTRRRYRALLAPRRPTAADAAPAAALSSAIAARRADVLAGLPGDAPAADELEARRERCRADERARFCVVCTVEERSIVLWPCRCLCLCEGCRASLADRTTSGGGTDGAAGTSGGSLCPTCRGEVQGFSRIWVP
ncbi:hypothetical protein JCM3770_005336 [Rhodotorula araucariae]